MELEFIAEQTITELPAQPRETLRQRVFRLDTSKCDSHSDARTQPLATDPRLIDLLARSVERRIERTTAARGGQS